MDKNKAMEKYTPHFQKKNHLSSHKCLPGLNIVQKLCMDTSIYPPFPTYNFFFSEKYELEAGSLNKYT